MMYIRIFFITVLTAPLFGQSLDLAKQGYAKLVEATNKLDFETIIDASYPKLLDLAGRETLIAEMKKAFSNPDIQLSFGKADQPAEYSEILDVGERRFCVIQRKTVMKLKLKKPLNETEAAAMQASIARGNPLRVVDFHPKENTFYSTGPDITIAVSDSATKKQWRYLGYESGQRLMLDSWFGAEAMAKLPLPTPAKVNPTKPETVTPEWTPGEWLNVENGKADWAGEEIPVYDAKETRDGSFKVFAETGKLSYSLHHLKNNTQVANAIAKFYVGKKLFGHKIGAFEETTDVGMPALESRNCGSNPKEGNIIKIMTDNTGHHVDIISGCAE